ncbi:N-acetylneuraminate synthase family protein [Hydrogenophaga sp.]|uniref:N-acetylneuraminate synthase family protein n=1 Tax=Hydrogenophaga sp. TaxID=1904254 RepID=UPI0027301518|nr:N-acetylneuraminate synthase family protein [Hydrogenophaga sp.]MDP2075514.1 N-acetylneuraminate synthase family protein [Hydrogenophaga sp.]MDP3107274.1 N-acetylneuraminate synthase family protein [Hydrogenophaga sp.]
MKIAHRDISPAHPPLVVAEIGINHGGSLDVAKGMVLAAHRTGCEMVKHQTHFVDDEMTDEAKQIFPPNADKSIWDVMEECALSKDDEIALKTYAESLGMIYISTPFSRAAADFLNDIGVSAFKIGSGECNHVPLIRHIASFGKPIIMSTGMQTIDGMRPSVKALDDAGVDYALLECTNLYPSPPEIVSLQGITELRNAFPRAVIGFSDHSIGPEMALSAVALGACILERHFTDTRYRKGPDISCSMDPAELKFLIDRSREIHTALNNPKVRTASEEDVYRFARGSMVADRDLPAGHVVSPSDIWARRPGSGEISVQHFDRLVGAKLTRAVKRNQQLLWSDLDGVKPQANS